MIESCCTPANPHSVFGSVRLQSRINIQPSSERQNVRTGHYLEFYLPGSCRP